jgi:hypothetical protein
VHAGRAHVLRWACSIAQQRKMQYCAAALQPGCAGAAVCLWIACWYVYGLWVPQIFTGTVVGWGAPLHSSTMHWMQCDQV